ncbi:MAG TPA: MBL fold metallo-hydrolase [Rhodothermales bacterium]|nr:MBL fold metallo-hydrolase [Rhodothermales bacterium]
MPADGKLHVAFLNVGNGDCTLIQCPNGMLILIDAGSRKWRTVGDDDPGDPNLIIGGVVIDKHYYAARLREFLRGQVLDMLVLTHNDADHYNMVAETLQGVPVRNVVHSNDIGEYKNEQFNRWLSQGLLIGTTVHELTVNAASPNPIRIVDGTAAGGLPCYLVVIASNVVATRHTSDVGWVKNTKSIVIHVEFGENTFLIMGDATEDTEDFLRTQYPPATSTVLNVDMLRVGHHGSITSTSDLFVQAVKPKAAAISISRLNSYGLPRTTVVNRLLGAGSLLPDTEHTIASYAGSGAGGVLPTVSQSTVWLWQTGWSGTRTFHFDGTLANSPWD